MFRTPSLVPTRPFLQCSRWNTLSESLGSIRSGCCYPDINFQIKESVTVTKVRGIGKNYWHRIYIYNIYILYLVYLYIYIIYNMWCVVWGEPKTRPLYSYLWETLLLKLRERGSQRRAVQWNTSDNISKNFEHGCLRLNSETGTHGTGVAVNCTMYEVKGRRQILVTCWYFCRESAGKPTGRLLLLLFAR